MKIFNHAYDSAGFSVAEDTLAQGLPRGGPAAGLHGGLIDDE